MIRTNGFLVLLIAVFLDSAAVADWPAFRGPTNSGIAAPGETAPTTWGPGEGIRWKVPLPRPGDGSPIVVGGRVLVTVAEDAEGKQRSLYCFDAENGKRLWVRTVELDKVMPTHKTNPYGGSTPVSDGRRVVVWHASAGLHCYDLDGQPLWSCDLGEFRHMWGYGTSPILHRGHVILYTGPGKRVFVTAVDLETGKRRWQTDEPVDGDGDRNPQGKFMGSWSSPVMARVNGADQVIVAMPTRIHAYDPDTGKIVWTCDGLRHGRGDLAYSSPLIVDGLCFMTGGFRGPSMAIRLGGSGNVTQTHRLWRIENNPQNIGSGVVVEGYVYRCHAEPGTIDCVDPSSGGVRWTARSEGGAHWGSIVMAGGLLYATGQNATTVVFKPNPEKFEPVAANRLEGSCNATPAVSGGRIFIRTMQYLYCIGE